MSALKEHLSEIIVGIVGFIVGVVGSVLVWAITKNEELQTQLDTLKMVGPIATAATVTAQTAEARANDSFVRTEDIIKDLVNAKKEADRIIAAIDSTPLFQKADEKLSELREAAESEARRVSKNLSLTKERVYWRTSEPKGCDSGIVSVKCDSGDIALGGGGSCGRCSATGRMEASEFRGDSWVVACDENNNQHFDGGVAQILCLRNADGPN